MQSKTILIGVTSQNCFYRSISVFISNKILLILARGPGGKLEAPPEAKAFLDFA